MLTAEARVETGRPSRYLVQLSRHFSHDGRHLRHRPPTHHDRDQQARREVQVHVEGSDTHGIVNFVPWGRCIMRATPNTLTLRVEANDEETLRRIQDLLTEHVTRFGRRDQLKVNWRRPEAPGEATGSAAPVPSGRAMARRGQLRTMVLAVAGALVVAVHLGLGGAVLAASRWTGWAADLVLAAVLVKVMALALGHLAIRRGKAAKARRNQR